MSKKLLTIILSLFMVLTTLPVSVFAENESIEEQIQETFVETTEEVQDNEQEVLGDSPSNWSLLANALAGEDQTSVTDVFTVENITSPESRKVTLLTDITAETTDSTLTIPEGKNIILDLNGHVLDRHAIYAYKEGLNYVAKFVNYDIGNTIVTKGNLSIEDSSPDEGHKFTYIGATPKAQGMILLHESGSTTVKGGIITGGYEDNGGAIYVESGKLTMNGGTIIGNYADSCGGGIMIDSNGTANISNVDISYNIASEKGGAIYIAELEKSSSGILSMTNSNLHNNKASSDAGAGGIYNNAGTLDLENVSITGNENGGVYNIDYNDEDPSMSISGKIQIKDNGNYNLKTSVPIVIDGALMNESEIAVSHVDNSNFYNAGVLTSGYTEKNAGAKVNDFFFYEGDAEYYMCLNTEGDHSGELEVKETKDGIYTIRVEKVNNGSATVDKYYAEEGETVTFIVHPNSGYELNKNGVFVDCQLEGYTSAALSLTQDIEDPNKFSFKMPTSNVSIYASFKEKVKVCKNGDNEYYSIGEAVKEAIDGDTIYLLTTTVKVNEIINVNKNITIDGNEDNDKNPPSVGKNKYITFDLGDVADIFNVTGKLTLKDLTINSKSNIASVHGKDAELIVDESATLNAANAVATNGYLDSYCINVYDGGKITANGKITNKYGTKGVIVSDGEVGENTTTIIVNNGATVKHFHGLAISLSNAADLTINGGDISGETGIYQKSGNLTINGGSITATGNIADFIIEEVIEEETVETINPNTGDAIVLDYSGCEGETPNVTINDGYFYSKNNKSFGIYATEDTENDPVENFVKGGYFSGDFVEGSYKPLSENLLYADKYIDYKCIENEEATKDKYGYVVVMNDYVAQNGTDNYTSLEKAVDDVDDKETIKLLADCSGTFTVSKAIEFSIDSNGFTNSATFSAGDGYELSTDTSGNVITYTFTLKHIHGDNGWNYSVKGNVLTATCKDCEDGTPYSVSATITNDGGTYNGEQFEATIENKTNFETTTGASIKAMYRKDKSTRASETAPINAGTYTCYIVVDGLKTREYASKRFTIAKATPTVTALPTASTITYGQSLRDSKLTGGIGSVAGKFTWKNGNTKPNATNGTEYKAVFTPTDSNNYSSVQVNVSVKVNKANYRTAVILNDWTYGQKSNNPRVSNNPENGNITYTYAKEGSDEFTAIKPTNAGKYVVKANIAETANYNSAEATDRFEIRKANGSGSVSVKDFTYTGKSETKPDVKLSSTTLDASKATYKFYTKNQRGQYVEVKPTIWNAGTYYVRAEFKSSNNYNAYTTDYVRFVVKKADANYKKPETNKLTYNGQDQVLVKAGGSFDGTMYYTLKYDVRHPERTIWTDNVKNITGKNAGEYTVYYYVKGDNNHNDSNVETIKVEIAKKKLEVVWSKTVEFTYNSQLQAPTATLKGVIGEEEVILGYRYRQGMNTNTQPIDAGKYIATTYLNENVKANSNYELIENTTKCFFKINKKVLTATWETLSFKYDGTNKKPTLILNGVEDKDIDSVNATIRVKGNAVEEGFYKVKASLDNKNYSLEEMRTIFFIFDDEPMHDGTITTGSVNSDKQRFLSTYTYKITEDNLDDILAYETGDKDAADKDAIVDALDNNGSIHFFTKVETTKEEDKSAFAEYSLNDNNAIFFDVNLYASIDGDTKVRRLFNANGYNVKVELTLTGDEASKIVGSRKNYYLLREHDGKVEKVDVDVKKNLDDSGNLISCTITFESNKFSTFALYSKNKPTPAPYIAPKTGIN